MTNLTNHQLAGDARNPFSFGGAGEGTISVETDLGTVNLTTGDVHNIYKFAKAGFVSQFAIKSDVNMDPHATPTLIIDIGTDTDPDEFIDGATAAQAFAGYFTNTASTGTATEAGFAVAAGDYILIDIDAGATASAVAGTLRVSFKYTSLT